MTPVLLTEVFNLGRFFFLVFPNGSRNSQKYLVVGVVRHSGDVCGCLAAVRIANADPGVGEAP